MTPSDLFIDNTLKEIKLKRSEPPRWKDRIHEVIDQRTGEVFDRIKDGYYCSYCGRYSHYKADKCKGCGSLINK